MIVAALCLLSPVAAARADGSPWANPAKVQQVLDGTLPDGEMAEVEWWGFDPADSTRFLQAAINSGTPRLHISNVGQDWIVRPISLVSNQELHFDPGTIVTAKAGAFGVSDMLFTIWNQSNIKIFGNGSTLRMRKEEYTTGEFRNALAIYSSRNIELRGLTLRDSGGDGLYLGDTGEPDALRYNENISVIDVTADNNRRQGISVISAKDLYMENVRLVNTVGTAPSSGIDFEPNLTSQRLQNITMNGVYIDNNDGSGITFSLPDLAAPVSINLDNVTIAGGNYTGILYQFAGQNTGGLVSLDHVNVSNTIREGLSVYPSSVQGPLLRVSNATFSNGAQNVAPSPFFGQLTDATQSPNPGPGGVELNNVVVADRHRRPWLWYIDQTGQAQARDYTGTVYVANPYGVIPANTNKPLTNLNVIWQWTPFVQTSFAAPQYVPGPIAGQDGWTTPLATGGADVVASGNGAPATDDGSPVVRLRRGGTVSLRAAFELGPEALNTSFVVEAVMAYGQASAGYWGTVYVNNSSTATNSGAIFGFAERNSAVAFRYYANGQMRDLTGAPLPAADTFYRFLAEIDPASSTFDLSVFNMAGTLLGAASNIPVRGGLSQFRWLSFNSTNGAGNTSTGIGDTLYVDRVLLALTLPPSGNAQIPEPAGAAASALSLTLLLRRRRRPSVVARSVARDTALCKKGSP